VWHDWWIGFFGSIIDLVGVFLANSAVATGKPAGPIFALIDSQIILVTIIVAIKSRIIPHWM
jgi:hypothetical protein